MDPDLGDSASTARPQAVKLEAPHMSKAERLHRWADNLELHRRLVLIDNAALGTRDEWFSTRADGSPLSVAFEDWAFRAEGLQGDRVRDALAFFDVSENEIQRIVSSSDYGRRTIRAAVAAERVRALAEQAEDSRVPQIGILVSGAAVAAVFGWRSSPS